LSSGGGYDATLEQAGGCTPISLPFVELGPGYVALDWTRRPIEGEPIQNGGEVRLDTACKAHERTESTGFRVLEPPAEIACTLSDDKTPKPLKQLVSGGEAFITVQHVM
jgi:hypothetical protein